MCSAGLDSLQEKIFGSFCPAPRCYIDEKDYGRDSFQRNISSMSGSQREENGRSTSMEESFFLKSFSPLASQQIALFFMWRLAAGEALEERKKVTTVSEGRGLGPQPPHGEVETGG